VGFFQRLFGRREKPVEHFDLVAELDRKLDEPQEPLERDEWLKDLLRVHGTEVDRSWMTGQGAEKRYLEVVRSLVAAHVDEASVVENEDGDLVVELRRGKMRDFYLLARTLRVEEIQEALLCAVNDFIARPSEKLVFLADTDDSEYTGTLVALTLEEARRLVREKVTLWPSPPERGAWLDRSPRRDWSYIDDDLFDDEPEPIDVGGAVEGLVRLGETLVIARDDAPLVVLADLGATRRELPIEAACLAHHGGRIYAGDRGGAVHVLDAQLAVVHTRTVARSAIRAIAAGDNAVLVSCVDEDDLFVLDPVDLEVTSRLRPCTGGPFGLVVFDDERVGGGDQVPAHYRVWDLVRGAVLASVPFDEASMIMTASVSADGARLAVLTDGDSALLDARTYERIAELPGGWACVWAPNGTLVMADCDVIVELDRDGRELARHEPFGEDYVGNISALVVGDRIIAGTERGRIWIGPPRG
jgi:hypothetical protein